MSQVFALCVPCPLCPVVLLREQPGAHIAPGWNAPIQPSRVQGCRAHCQTGWVTFPSQLILPLQGPPRGGAL